MMRASFFCSLEVRSLPHPYLELFRNIMNRVKSAACLLVSMAFFMGCDHENFSKDPLCATCIARACEESGEAREELLQHFASSEAPIQAQLLSRMEAYEGCPAKLDPETVSSLYRQYGASFFATTQPYVTPRALHAVEAIHADNPNASQAAAYLTHHLEAVRQDGAVLADVESKLLPLAEARDAVFSLLTVLLPTEKLAPLVALPQTEARDAALLAHYPDFDEETRERLLKPYILGAWHIQSSGSTALPQYLELDWGMLPMPENVVRPVASLAVKSVTVRGEEAKKRGVFVRTAFEDAPLMRPDRHKKRVDLGAWLKQADSFRITANADISLWQKDVSSDCLSGKEGCEAAALATFPVKLDMTYRAYIGVDTGAPRRSKSAEENTATTRAMQLQICNETACTDIWDGKLVAQKNRVALDVTQGHDFYLLAQVGAAQLPVAGRLMARSIPGETWREVATFFSFAPSRYAPSVRANIDASTVCRNMGKCELELQLRPSLRMARRDPEIKQYWGETLELGRITLNIMNRTPQQIYREIL